MLSSRPRLRSPSSRGHSTTRRVSATTARSTYDTRVKSQSQTPPDPDPRRPRRLEPVYLTLAIVTYTIAVICLLLPIGRLLRGMPIKTEVFPAAGLFALAGTGLLVISVGRARR